MEEGELEGLMGDEEDPLGEEEIDHALIITVPIELVQYVSYYSIYVH